MLGNLVSKTGLAKKMGEGLSDTLNVSSELTITNPTVPALAAVFGANHGFMLPVSTPPNAIVYSSGYLPITRMIKAGAVFDAIGAVLASAVSPSWPGSWG